MANLKLVMLGSFQAAFDDQALIAFRSDKVRALLAYLAIESDRPHSRASLCGLLWPEHGDAAALHNLSQTLLRLRDGLAAAGETTSLLLTTRQTIQWNPAGHYQLDVASFSRLATSDTVTELERAAELYAGPLLPGFSLDGCTAFDEWLLLTRERLGQLALKALDTLSAAKLASGAYAEAERYARRQLELDPWREEAHRQIMQAMAASGQRSAALAQYESCSRVLNAELGVEPDVETRALYERIRAGTFSPGRPTAAAHNLPAQLTPFVGREHELAELAAQLEQPEVRLLTLAGAGGMGKTRLALEAARAQLATFPDGVFLVQLAPLTAATGIAPAITAALGIAVHSGDPWQAVLYALHSKRLLLVMDNFEHVLDGAELVTELLEAAPRVQVVVTSRERLNLRGEQLFSVHGLAYQRTSQAIDTPAVRLFVQSARRLQPAFRLTTASLPAVQRICELVDGMPLGLELAAAWADMLPLEEIAAAIEQSWDFLEVAWRDVPQRQRSMRAVFDWSWTLLDQSEQRVLRQLSVFRGGFTRAAAQAVVGASLPVLTRLVQKSLVHRGTAERYTIHELLRQFAAEQLDAAPEERAAVDARHSEYFLQYVAQREARLCRNEPREAAAEIRAEIDNLRRAWASAASRARLAELDRSALTVRMFYSLTGLHAEGEAAFRAAVAQLQTYRARAAADNDPRGHELERVLSTLLALHANTLVTHRAFDQAQLSAQQAVALGASSGGVEGEAFGMFAWGHALTHKAEFDQGRARCETALALARSQQPGVEQPEMLRLTECAARIVLASIATYHNDYVATGVDLDAGLQACRRVGDVRGEMSCLIELAHLAQVMHDYAVARQHYTQALDRARRVGDRWAEGTSLYEIGDIARAQGEYSSALELLERGLALLHELGDLKEEARVLSRLGRLQIYLGEVARARVLLERSLHLSREVGARLIEADACRFLALLANHTGVHARGVAYAEQGWRLAQEIGSRAGQARALIVVGHLQAAMHLPMEAAAAYRQAVTLCEQIGDAPLSGEAFAGLAALALAEHDQARALDHAETLLKLLGEHELVGMDEPFYVYLECCRVLDVTGDPRAATVLQAARTRLRAYAEHISQDALRRSFLFNLATHRGLADASEGSSAPEHRSTETADLGTMEQDAYSTG